MSAASADALVFYGATGDLAFKKIFPALQRLTAAGALEMPVIGVAKSGITLPDLVTRARESVVKHGGGVDEAAFARLVSRLHYVDGDYADPDTFAALKHELGSARLPVHYMAIPQGLFGLVGGQLAKAGLSERARLVVEKPFGNDLASARALNATLHEHFPESHVYRIDHYLGKSTVQKLAFFRFANAFLEPIWNRNYWCDARSWGLIPARQRLPLRCSSSETRREVASSLRLAAVAGELGKRPQQRASHHYVSNVQITMAEDFGVEGRGAFYDQAGAIRDVVQNHLLQVLSNIAMEPPPRSHDTETVREEKVKVLKGISPLSPKHVVRGQFTGYRDEPGVAPGSRVETFVALKLDVNNWRWQGVPFYIRAGKCLPVSCTEVVVKLRTPPAIADGAAPPANYFRFRLSPDFVIALGAVIQASEDELGGASAAEPVELELTHDQRGDPEPYEELLGDALQGDTFRFAREDWVEEVWRIVDPAVRARTKVFEYAPGTWGPPEAEALVPGGWFVSEDSGRG